MTQPSPWSIVDKTCLVTGATSGIGRAATLQLLRTGAGVIAVARNSDVAARLHDDLSREVPGSLVDVVPCDLSQLRQVRALAEAVLDRGGADVLINCAGVSKAARELTAEGHEVTFAVNQLAPFLLTSLLLPSLRQLDGARVLMVSSDVHKMEKTIPWDDIEGEQDFKPRRAYGLSKLFNILLTVALAERLKGTAVTVNCYSPGFVRTGLAREATGPFSAFLALTKPFQRSAQDAAADAVHLVTAPELSAVSGRYFAKRRPKEPSALARDHDSAERLWSLCSDLCNPANHQATT